MSEHRNQFTALAHNLDDRQRTILIAGCIKLLIDDDTYSSPLFGSSGKQVEGLIEKLATANPTDLATPEWPTMAVDLQSAEQEQKQVIVDAEAEAKEWTTGKWRNDDDAWIPITNAGRARDGGVIIRWLIGARRDNWMCSNVPSEIEQVLVEKGNEWMQRFADLRTAIGI